MSRITTNENVTLTKEAVSPTTIIVWNPEDNSGHVEWRTEFFTYVDGELVNRIPGRPLYTQLSDILTRTYTVETPDGPVDVPAALLMGAIKKAFDDHYNESLAPPKEPTPTEPEVPASA